MKLFSRKALVAGATALSMTFARTTVATAAESTTQSTTAQPTTTKAAEPAEQGSSLNDADRKEIQAWIGVVTAVIGALGTLFAFANKYLDLPFGNK